MPYEDRVRIAVVDACGGVAECTWLTAGLLPAPLRAQFAPLFRPGLDRRFADVPVRTGPETGRRYGFGAAARDRFRAWVAAEAEHGPYADVDVFDGLAGVPTPVVVAVALPGVDPTAEQAAFRARGGPRLAAVRGPLCPDCVAALLSTPGPRVVLAARGLPGGGPVGRAARAFAAAAATALGVTACQWAADAAAKAAGGPA